MFKAFLIFSIFFMTESAAFAQTSFKNTEGSQENMLSKYINASAVCAKMTDPVALYERGMLLLSDANDEAFIAASDCFTSAALRNHTPSQLELGKLYEHGQGVTASNIFAYKWYQTAVLLGNKEAIPFRNSLESRMALDEIAMANPMIQSTLDLIEIFNQHQQADLEKFETKIAKKYNDFGVNIGAYDVKEEAGTTFSNPLIEALIRDQQKKEEAIKGPKSKSPDSMPGFIDQASPEQEESDRAKLRRLRNNGNKKKDQSPEIDDPLFGSDL